MSECGESIRVMHPLFHSGEGGSIPTSPLDLWFSDIDKSRFRQLNRLWHADLPDTDDGGYRAMFVAQAGGLFYATAQWTNPASPKLPQREWIELKRYAIADDAPRYTASRMLGWMTREIYKRFAEVTTLVTYLDVGKHNGVIYKACGWKDGPIERRSPKTTWKNRARRHTKNAPPEFVQRWTKRIR
jgi:hypothetical protein